MAFELSEKQKERDKKRYGNGTDREVDPKWEKMFCQRISQQGHTWTWWRNGDIVRDDDVIHHGYYQYDAVTFIQIIAVYGECAGDIQSLQAYIAMKEAKKAANRLQKVEEDEWLETIVHAF